MNLPVEPALLELVDQVAHEAALARLRAALDAAFDTGTGFGPAVRAALAQALSDAALVLPAQRESSAERYRRHMLLADPAGRYAVASLVWLPGQASPIHAHHTWCGYAVLEGTLSESLYSWDETAHYARLTRVQDRPSGAHTWADHGRHAIHRLANESDAPAVSLHVYGVPAAEMATHVNDLLPGECTTH